MSARKTKPKKKSSPSFDERVAASTAKYNAHRVGLSSALRDIRAACDQIDTNVRELLCSMADYPDDLRYVARIQSAAMSIRDNARAPEGEVKP